jgi:hypothetical protein
MSLKRCFTTAALCLLILFVTRVSQARSIGRVFTIPFEFYVGDKLLPAGTYVVELDQTAGYIEVHNKIEFASLGIYVSPVLRDCNYKTLNGRLVFDSYGTAHILKKVWMEGEIRGALLQSSRAEREMAKTAEAKAKIASR